MGRAYEQILNNNLRQSNQSQTPKSHLCIDGHLFNSLDTGHWTLGYVSANAYPFHLVCILYTHAGGFTFLIRAIHSIIVINYETRKKRKITQCQQKKNARRRKTPFGMEL